MLHRMRGHRSAANHAGDFLLGFSQGAGDDVGLNVLSDVCPAKVTVVRFHKSPLISYAILLVRERGKKPPGLRLVRVPEEISVSTVVVAVVAYAAVAIAAPEVAAVPALVLPG